MQGKKYHYAKSEIHLPMNNITSCFLTYMESVSKNCVVSVASVAVLVWVMPVWQRNLRPSGSPSETSSSDSLSQWSKQPALPIRCTSNAPSLSCNEKQNSRVLSGAFFHALYAVLELGIKQVGKYIWSDRLVHVHLCFRNH